MMMGLTIDVDACALAGPASLLCRVPEINLKIHSIDSARRARRSLDVAFFSFTHISSLYLLNFFFFTRVLSIILVSTEIERGQLRGRASNPQARRIRL